MDANAWLIDLSGRSAARFFETPFAELTEPERVFVAVWTLEADVNNGENTAAIVERANAAFGPDGPPPDRDRRLATMDELSEVVEELWSACDQAFYAYPDDLTALLRAYVQSHQAGIQGAV